MPTSSFSPRSEEELQPASVAGAAAGDAAPEGIRRDEKEASTHDRARRPRRVASPRAPPAPARQRRRRRPGRRPDQPSRRRQTSPRSRSCPRARTSPTTTATALTDLADPDCTGPLDATESGPAAPAPPPDSDADPSRPTRRRPTPGRRRPRRRRRKRRLDGPAARRRPGGGTAAATASRRQRRSTADGRGRRATRPAAPASRWSRPPTATPTAPRPTPTPASPSPTSAPAPIGVPNFVIDQFAIPPFLLPIYQACGTQYGIPWQVLASINRIETAFGTNLNVSTAGALGWMQFMPSTWEMYGVDANDDGRKDPYNPVDAICAAARYLQAPPAARTTCAPRSSPTTTPTGTSTRSCSTPTSTASSPTTWSARSPASPRAPTSRSPPTPATPTTSPSAQALERSKPGKGAAGNAADVISTRPPAEASTSTRSEGAPVVAVNDGVINEIGETKELGKYIVLQDAYGNRFTYAELGEVSEVYPVPKEHELTAKDFELVTPERRRRARRSPASAGDRRSTSRAGRAHGRQADAAEPARPTTAGRQRAPRAGQHRGHPRAPLRLPRARRQRRARRPHRPARRAARRAGCPATRPSRPTSPASCASTRRRWSSTPLRGGLEGHRAAPCSAGSARPTELAPHVHFAIQPAGRGAPKIDPKPILDGWKLLEATAIYRAAGKNPFDGTAPPSARSC